MTNLITSLQNPRVKLAARLRLGRQRARQNRIVIDGMREIARAVQARVVIEEAFVCPGLADSAECRALVQRLAESGATVWQVSAGVFEKLAFGERAEGIVAVAEMPHRRLADLSLPAGGLVAIVEGVEKPGNIGAILRSADGAGLGGRHRG